MTEEKKIHKYVNDLGIAAYMLMHGYQVVGKKAKSIYFEVHSQAESDDFDNLVLDYQPPNDFYTFDSCLMFLKKINEYIPKNLDEKTHKCVNDLGVAAYLLMHEYRKPNSIGLKAIGRQGKNVWFQHPEGADPEFKRLTFEYYTSQFATYDANLMSLKKIDEYMPK